MNEGKRLRSPLGDTPDVDGNPGADKRARIAPVLASDITSDSGVNGIRGDGGVQVGGGRTTAGQLETGGEEAARSEDTTAAAKDNAAAAVNDEDGDGDDMEMDSVDGDQAVDEGAGGLRALLGEQIQPGVMMFGMVGGVGPRMAEPAVEQSSRQFVAQFWKENVSTRLLPTYDLVRSTNPKLYGCSLEFLLPPSSESRKFVIPIQFKGQKEAKNAVAKLAIDAGILEEGRAAREAAGPELVDAEGDADETTTSTVSLLHNAYQKYMPVAAPIYTYSIDELNQTHGATLTVPITDTITETFTTAPTFPSRQKAAIKVAREALDAVVPLMETEYKRRLFNETDGYLSFNGVDPAREEATLNLPSFIQGIAKRYLSGGKDALSLMITHASIESTDPEIVHSKLYGATLRIPLSPADVRTFTTDNKWPSTRHARTAVICAALKAGIVDAMKESKRARGDTSVVVETWEMEPQGKTEKKDKKGKKDGKGKKDHVALPVPRPGSVADEDLEHMEQAIAYLNTCFQQWTSQSAPIQFKCHVDSETKKFGAVLTCAISPTRRESYNVPYEFATKKDAKDAVVRLALREKVLDLIKPGSEAQLASAASAAIIKVKMEGDGGTSIDRPKNKRVKGKKGAHTDGDSSMDPTAPVYQPPARSGYEGTPAPQQFQRNHREQSFAPPPFPPPSANGYPPPQYFHGPPQFNQYQPGFTYPQYGGPPPPFGHQPSYYGSPGPGYGHPQQYGGSQMYGGYQAPQMGLPQDAVRYLDDFCQGLMGAGHLPSYEAHQDAQSGLFGAVLRLNITATNIKSFYVDCGFHSRSESQDAVARIALQDGIEQTIRLEFPPDSSPGPVTGPPFPPPPQQQFQRQHQQSPFNPGPAFAQHQQQQHYRPIVPPQFGPSTPHPFRSGSMAPTNGFNGIMEPLRPIMKTESPHYDLERKVDPTQRIASPFPSTSTPSLPPYNIPPPLPRAFSAIRPSPAVVSTNNHDASSPLPVIRRSSTSDPSILLAIQSKCNTIRGSDIPIRISYFGGASDTHTFVCVLSIPVDDNAERAIKFETESSYASKRAAKEATLAMAIKEGVYERLQEGIEEMKSGEEEGRRERERVEEEGTRAAAEEARRRVEDATVHAAREAAAVAEEKAETERKERKEAARQASATKLAMQVKETARVEMAEKLAKEQEAASARDAAAKRREASKEAAALEAQERQTIEQSSSATLVDGPTTNNSRENDAKPNILDISTRPFPQSRLSFLDSPSPGHALAALLKYCIDVGYAPPRFTETAGQLVAFVEGFQFEIPPSVLPLVTTTDPKEKLCASILRHLKKQKAAAHK